jgi:cyclopropane fatty-acyl-phospholipid synthase-like methyltransferase
MPGSEKEGKELVVNWVKDIKNINKVLDVGCGKGTYSLLLKNENKLLNETEWWAVEAWAPYNEKFGLYNLYDEIINEDARKLDWSNLPDFDIIFCGDVLEHMKKQESQTLVNLALQRTRYLIISIPIILSKAQGAVNGNHFEKHIKRDWSHTEVMSSYPNIVDSNHKAKRIGVYLLKGSLNDT